MTQHFGSNPGSSQYQLIHQKQVMFTNSLTRLIKQRSFNLIVRVKIFHTWWTKRMKLVLLRWGCQIERIWRFRFRRRGLLWLNGSSRKEWRRLSKLSVLHPSRSLNHRSCLRLLQQGLLNHYSKVCNLLFNTSDGR